MTTSPEFIRLGLRKRNADIRLRLRWDRSPKTCASIVSRIPLESQVYHAKYANNEVYMLVPAPEEAPGGEWHCMYPAPGDLLYIPLMAGVILPKGGLTMDTTKGVIDIAYFYDRGNSLVHGPAGPTPGTIFATPTNLEDIEKFGAACSDVWMAGAVDECLYIEED